MHINALELKAIYFGLRSLCSDLADKHIRIMTDNTKAVACVNKQGSTKSKVCNGIAKEIWLFAIDKKLWLSTAHCPGSSNILADQASREFDDQTEWSLNIDLFKVVCGFLGEPEIDLFASRLNHRVPQYYAWEPDPGAVFIDSFMYDWGQEFVYAFPPFSIIHMVIQKWIQGETEGIIIVPLWPSQPWFTFLTRLIVGKPLTIDVVNAELMLPFSNRDQPRKHPMVGNLTLLVDACSGKRWLNKAARQQSFRHCFNAGEQAQTNFINVIWTPGRNIASSMGLVPSTHLSLRHWISFRNFWWS